MTAAAVILAAGKGTRMKSDLPKGLHRVCGVPMVGLVAQALRGAGVERIIVVVGHGGDQIIKELGPSCDYAWQHEQLGTGHAAKMAMPLLQDFHGPVIITPGDTPLLEADIFCQLLQAHREGKCDCTVSTFVVPDPTGYGRVVRDAKGRVQEIVEHKDATEAQREIQEVNAAIYCFDSGRLAASLEEIRSDNSQGEYYLPDAVKIISAQGGKCETMAIGDPSVLMGVNDRWQLSEAAKVLRARVLKRHALAGVTIVDPDSTYIEATVEIGADTTIEPGTILEGSTQIGEGCSIGPNTKIQDSQVGSGCTVLMSHLNEAVMHSGSRCGPFANLRPGAVIGEEAKVGNFVEVKNATLGRKASVSHLSYIGDGSVGDRANIGAGTIFCNYDGYTKSRTEVGSDAFVGSNSTLIAPVTIGDRAFVAAGSTITKPVPEDALALGRAKQEIKEEWVISWKKRKEKS